MDLKEIDLFSARKQLATYELIEDVNAAQKLLDLMCYYFKTEKIVGFLMEEFQLKENEAYAFLNRYGQWEDKYDL